MNVYFIELKDNNNKNIFFRNLIIFYFMLVCFQCLCWIYGVVEEESLRVDGAQ